MKSHSKNHKLLYLAFLTLFLHLLHFCQSRPFRGPIKWSFLLCLFSDSSTPTRDLSFFQDMIVNRGTGGLNDFWRSVSYNGVNLDGSIVKGWYTMKSSSTQAQQELAKPDRDREKYLRECIDTAKNSIANPYTVPADHHIGVITEPGVDLWGRPGAAFFPSNIDLGGLSHEVGHGLGLAHSFSNDPNYRNVDWAQIGEYDDQWDTMSYANVLGTWTSRFGFGGPGLNAYHVDRLGWMPMSRVFTFGADGVGSRVLTLAALNHPETSGYFLIRIPFDVSDPYHYYTVEFRKNDGWDAGFPASIVLIHEVKGPYYYSYLMRAHTGSRNPTQYLLLNGVEISIRSVSPTTNQATVAITSNIVSRCLSGYVWREASPTDLVCVTPEVRTQTKNDNAQAATRRLRNGYCITGYVWREAFAGDQVCVLPKVRAQALADNAEASNRKNPSRFTYGPNKCLSGYVWREADRSDYVCVNPAVRTQVGIDNGQAAARRNPNGAYGPYTCVSGYVWREAFPEDLVCVTVQVREQARTDNAQAQSRLAKP